MKVWVVTILSPRLLTFCQPEHRQFIELRALFFMEKGPFFLRPFPAHRHSLTSTAYLKFAHTHTSHIAPRTITISSTTTAFHHYTFRNPHSHVVSLDLRRAVPVVQSRRVPRYRNENEQVWAYGLSHGMSKKQGCTRRVWLSMPDLPQARYSGKMVIFGGAWGAIETCLISLSVSFGIVF